MAVLSPAGKPIEPVFDRLLEVAMHVVQHPPPPPKKPLPTDPNHEAISGKAMAQLLIDGGLDKSLGNIKTDISSAPLYSPHISWGKIYFAVERVQKRQVAIDRGT